MSKSTTVTVSLDEDAYGVFQTASEIVSKAGIRVPTGQLVQTMINAEMSRLSAREIAQRFLKSIMKQVGVLSGQHPDDDEDDTIPSISAPRSGVNTFSRGGTTVNQRGYGADVAETLCAEIASHMAIASPKNKEELVRQFKFNPEVNTRLEAFMKAEPGLVQFVKELPREQLERKFLLRKMRDQQQKHGYDAKVKAWLEKPEQVDLVKSLKATISPDMKPERQAQMLVNQAKNYIRNTGLKIS